MTYSLPDLQARDEPLVPNRILGSFVSIEGGTVDVVVPPERAAACLGTELSASPEDDWARLRDQAEREGDTHTGGYARRRGLYT